MRALSGALEAAQVAATGDPTVSVVVRNLIHGTAHVLFDTEYYSAADGDVEHDAAADADHLYRARVKASFATAEWSIDDGGTWAQLGVATVNVIAIDAINDERVIVVYNRGAELFFRESTNQGGSFGSETSILTAGATPAAVSVAYKNSTGDLAVFYEDAGDIKRVRRTSGTFGSPATWSQSANSVNGLDAMYDGDFCLAVTGTDTDDRPTVWSLLLGDGVTASVDTWARFYIVNQAEAESDITFQAPFIGEVIAKRITFVEVFAGTPSYTRAFWTAPQALVDFSNGDWETTDPAPLDDVSDHGVAVCRQIAGTSYAFLSRPALVLQGLLASGNLDMSADLIEAEIVEDDGITQRGRFVFDNSHGNYAGPPDPIRLYRDVDIDIGWDGVVSPPPRQSIVGWSYERTGGRSLFVLHTRGVQFWLARSRPRTSIVHAGIAGIDVTRKAAARAGLELAALSPSDAAENLALDWAIHDYQDSLHALNAVLELLPDIVVTNATWRLSMFEPTAADSVDYNFTTEGHPVYESRTREDGAAAFAEVIGAAAVGQAFDFVAIDHNRPLTDRRRDVHSTDATEAGDFAAARLRRAQLGRGLGEIVVPPHCGLEIRDVVAYADALVSGSTITGRVTAIKTSFRRKSGSKPVFEQKITLGGL